MNLLIVFLDGKAAKLFDLDVVFVVLRVMHATKGGHHNQTMSFIFLESKTHKKIDEERHKSRWAKGFVLKETIFLFSPFIRTRSQKASKTLAGW